MGKVRLSERENGNEMKMIKGAIQAGPCRACGATGKYDPEMYDDPDDFIDCEFCKGTGFNPRNHIVIERETGLTKLGKQVEILGTLYDTYLDLLRDPTEGTPDDIAIIYALNQTEETQAGILTAVLFRSGMIDRTQYAKDVIACAWESVLDEYDWEYDMKFKNFKELRAGGKEWQKFDESNY
jgi:hypothetical protein